MRKIGLKTDRSTQNCLQLPTEIEKPAGKAALALTEVDQDPDLSILLTLQSIKPPISRIRPLYPYLIVL